MELDIAAMILFFLFLLAMSYIKGKISNHS
jgi:hypothetical protein